MVPPHAGYRLTVPLTQASTVTVTQCPGAGDALSECRCPATQVTVTAGSDSLSWTGSRDRDPPSHRLSLRCHCSAIPAKVISSRGALLGFAAVCNHDCLFKLPVCRPLLFGGGPALTNAKCL